MPDLALSADPFVPEPQAFFEGRRVLVAGGTGFIGSHFVEALVASGASVRVPVHTRPLSVAHPRIEAVTADLSTPDGCSKAMRGVQDFVHAAGPVGAAGVSPVGAMERIVSNLLLTGRLLEAAWATGIERVLIFGSSTGYPATLHAVREEEMWTGPTHPSYLGYGWMRRYLEKLSEFVSVNSHVLVAIVRPTAVYGPRDNFGDGTSHVIPALIKRALSRENPFDVWGTGDEVRDFLHVTDFVRGSLLTLARHASCDPVNIGYGTPVTIRQTVEYVLRACGHEATLCFDPSKPTAIPVRVVDTSKARALLGFTPRISLEQGLAQTAQWYRETRIAVPR
jgi:GDP-L-fucose synthase